MEKQVVMKGKRKKVKGGTMKERKNKVVKR
jgi:hypothetical protein